ncbi:MAG TPA: efflux RND transporter permease subunit [Myxococcota bacterium]|nr:efflux RND transporter permease subunit [Myxococcota bacterium]
MKAGPDSPQIAGAPEDSAGGALAWMARNSVAANLLMMAFVIGGLLMSFRIKKEVFPQIELDEVDISVPYPGASPAEVEQGILLSIEEAVRSLDGVKEVTSSAMEGMGSVAVELEVGTDRNKALADVKNAIDRITTFPAEAERPIVNLPEWRVNAISVVIYGDQPEKVLAALGEQVRDDVLRLPEVTNAELIGVRPIEIDIEVPSDTLRAYGLTLSQIAAVVHRTSVELPAGGVKTDAGEVLLRTNERRDLGSEFTNIPILTGEDGSPVRLGQIADIKDGYAETDVQAFFNGKSAVMVQVYSVGQQSPTDVAKAVKSYAGTLAQTLPPGVQVATWNDNSKLYNERLDLLLRNAMMGLVLVLFILGLFLEPKLAFWVTIGIPISFLGSLMLLPVLGISINMMSLFAFIVTLGMVVDDAIVVGENSFRFRREGMPFLKASISGTKQVAMPVFFSVATTVAAFSPLLFIPGNRGKWMYGIPVVVIVVLLVSLVECFFILPAHLGHLVPTREGSLYGRLVAIQSRFSRGVEKFVERVYLPVARAAIRQRWITLACGIAVFLGAIGLISGERVKFIDFPKEESDGVVAEADLPFGSAVEETHAVMDRMVAAAQEVIEENGGSRISTGIFSMLGVSFHHHHNQATGSHVASVIVTLVPTDQRPIGAGAFADKWRTKIGPVPGLESLEFDSSTGHGGSKPIDIELSHSNISVLEAAARELAAKIETFDGVRDVDDGIDLGKPQLDFTLSPDGIGAGLSTFDLASQVRSAFYGAEAFRQQRGRYELKVLVRLPRAERTTLHSVEEMMIRTPAGGEMPLRRAARVRWGRAYTSIDRTNGKRTVRVKADVIEGKANPQQIMSSVFGKVMPRLQSRYQGLGFGSAGRQKEMREFFDFLKLGFLMALIAMYGLIAIPLRSYMQPLFVVMMAIPFGFVGALLGHLLMGLPLSLISLMGIVALSGVVVNDSIVLTTAANRFRGSGQSAIEAALSAGRQRFRPVILTSLTTFGGLAPMIFETSLQARMLIPMAVSLGFGVMFSTLVTLVLVPSLFVMIENLRGSIRSWRDPAAAEPGSLPGEMKP